MTAGRKLDEKMCDKEISILFSFVYFPRLSPLKRDSCNTSSVNKKRTLDALGNR